MYYCYCSSYEHIYFALYLKNVRAISIAVITRHPGLIEFCNDLGIKVFFFKHTKKIISFNFVKQFMYLYKQKKTIDQFLNTLNISASDKLIIPTMTK